MKMTSAKKIILTVLITIIVIISVVYIFASHQEKYEKLYSGISLETAQKVIEILKKEDVSWKFDDSSGTLYINSNDIGKINKKSLDIIVH